MKKLSFIILGLLIVFSAGHINYVSAADAEKIAPATNWNIFGKNLEKALLSQNPGLQQSAMQMVIRYGGKLHIGQQGTLEILHTYRSNADLQARRLALAAIPKTGSKFMMGYLKRAVLFEKSPVLKKQIEFILAEAEKK